MKKGFFSKYLAFLIVISIVLANITVTYASVSDYITQSELVTLSIDNGKVSIDTSITLTNAKLVLSSYSDNQLIDLRIVPITLGAGMQANYNIPVDLEISDQGSLKAMLWRSFNDCTPLACYAENKGVTITNDQLFSVSANEYGDYILVRYFENPSDRYPKSYKIDFDTSSTDQNGGIKTRIYVNGVMQDFIDAYDIVKLIGKAGDKINEYNNTLYDDAFNGTLMLADNNAEYDFNTIYVTDYKTMVVDEVNTLTSKIIPLNDENALIYANTSNTVEATLYGPDSQIMNWSDLKRYDVVTYTIANDNGKDIIKGWVVNNSVTGTVQSIYPSDDQITINGKEYSLNTNYMTATDFALGETGTFYLDKLGKIVYANTSPLINSNYAYVIQAGAYDNGFQNVMQLKLFTKDGTIKNYNVATRVKIDGISFETDRMISADGRSLQDATVNYSTSIPALINQQGNDDSCFIWDNSHSMVQCVKSIKPGDLIIYDENISGDITIIDRPFQVTNAIDMNGKFTQYKSEYANTIFSAGDKSLIAGGSKFYITDNTVIMLAPGGHDEDAYEIINVDQLADEQEINYVSFFNVNVDHEIGCIVIGDPSFAPEGGNNTFIIANAPIGITTNSEGDVVGVIRGMRDGAVLPEPLITTTDVSVDGIEIGTIFIPLLNSKGEVKAINLLCQADNYNNRVEVHPAVLASNANVSGKVHYYYGKIQETNMKTVSVLNPDTNVTEDVTIPNDANFYIYDERQSSSRRVLDDGNISVVDAEYNAASGTTEYIDNTGLDQDIRSCDFFARENNGVIVDVVLYIFD